MRPSRVALAVAAMLAGLQGCVYYNTLYNARERFDAGERAREAGDADAARAAYGAAVEKAARGFRSDPTGRWADDALYLMGRAWFRTGELARSVRALEETLARTDDPAVRRGALLYLGAARTRLGEGIAALGVLNEAMRSLPPGPLAAEGHFWRGVLHFRLGRRDQGLWDLDRAVEADPSMRVAALLARAGFGVETRDTALVHHAFRTLASLPAGAGRADSLASLAGRLRRSAGAAEAAAALAPFREAVWRPGPGDDLLLLRAALLREAGDTVGARELAGWLAEGAGPRGVPARTSLARWELAGVREVTELGRVRELLLPAAGEPGVVELTDGMRAVEILDAWGRGGEPLAFFAAAEVARDRLGAPDLARAFFLRHAAEYPDGPWTGKAMLAALATTPRAGGDPALLEGLEARTWDPYVATARTGTVGARRVGLLEQQLAVRLAELMARVEAEVRRRDARLRGGDTLSTSPRPVS